MGDDQQRVPGAPIPPSDSEISLDEVPLELMVGATIAPLDEVFRQTVPGWKVVAAAFFHDASAVALGGFHAECETSKECDLMVWNLLNGCEDDSLRKRKNRCGTRKMAVSPNGRYVAYMWARHALILAHLIGESSSQHLDRGFSRTAVPEPLACSLGSARRPRGGILNDRRLTSKGSRPTRSLQISL